MGNAAVPGALEAVEQIRARGKRAIFVTNNSSKTRAAIAKKITDLGLPCTTSEVVTSAWATAQLLLLSGFTRVHPIGSPQLADEMANNGLEVVGFGGAGTAAVLGFTLDFNFSHLESALQSVRAGSELFACNRERTFPGEGGREVPGLGPVVAAVEYATSVSATQAAGKPNSWMLKALQSDLGLRAAEMLMIGDSKESDIVMAREFGCRSIWIHQGLESSPPQNIAIDLQARDLAEAVKLIS